MTQKHSDDTAATRAFFESWKLYDTVIRHNYMCHQQIIATLRLVLRDVENRPLRVLELGCGDAWVASEVFGADHDLEYHGLDLSAPAMAIGQPRVNALGWKNSRWIEAAFPEGLFELEEPYDVILSGFALHHLKMEKLNVTLAECCRLLKPSGSLMVYDELLKPGESKVQYLQRLLEIIDRDWLELDETQREATHAHILNYDYPMSFEQWQSVANIHGLQPPEKLYLDDAKLFSVFRFNAAGA